jgi:hypothetical protein
MPARMEKKQMGLLVRSLEDTLACEFMHVLCQKWINTIIHKFGTLEGEYMVYREDDLEIKVLHHRSDGTEIFDDLHIDVNIITCDKDVFPVFRGTYAHITVFHFDNDEYDWLGKIQDMYLKALGVDLKVARELLR